MKFTTTVRTYLGIFGSVKMIAILIILALLTGMLNPIVIIIVGVGLALGTRWEQPIYESLPLRTLKAIVFLGVPLLVPLLLPGIHHVLATIVISAIAMVVSMVDGKYDWVYGSYTLSLLLWGSAAIPARWTFDLWALLIVIIIIYTLIDLILAAIKVLQAH